MRPPVSAWAEHGDADLAPSIGRRWVFRPSLLLERLPVIQNSGLPALKDGREKGTVLKAVYLGQ